MTEAEAGLAGVIAFRGSLDGELQLVREAVALVAAGKAPRVVLAGIRYGSLIFEPARALAGDAGLRLTPIERTDHRGIDLSIERVPA